MKTKLILDVNKTQHAQLNSIVTGRVGDKVSNIADIYLIDGGSPYNLTGSKVFFECVKPDNTVVRDDNGVKMIDATKGHFEYTFPTETFGAIGKAKQAFMSIEKDKIIRATTQDFVLITLPDAMTNRIPSESYLSDLEKLIKELNEMSLEEINSQAAAEASAAKEFAEKANELSNSVQTQLDTIVVNGDSSVEAAQARTDVKGDTSSSLKARLDKEQVKIEGLLDSLKFTANADNPLIIATYDGLNQTTHPKVVYFENGWSGWKYWMAHTPYPNSIDRYENPSISVSNDGTNWVNPSGIVNPIDQPTEAEITDKYHMSDTHLLLVNGYLECWYRFNKNGVTDQIMRKKSSDGINWSEREVMYTLSGNNMALSPAIVFDENKYKMWYVTGNFEIKYTESPDGKTWGNIQSVTINTGSKSYRPWHLDVIKYGTNYEMLLNAGDASLPLANDRKELLHGVSNNPTNFSLVSIMNPTPANSGKWDNYYLYRSCLVKIGSYYKIYYAAMSQMKKWHVGLTESANIKNLIGLSLNNMDGDLVNVNDIKPVRDVILEKGNKVYLSKTKASYVTSNEVKLVEEGVGGARLKLETWAPDTIGIVGDNGKTYGSLKADKFILGYSELADNDLKLLNKGVSGVHLKAGNRADTLEVRNDKNTLTGNVEAAIAYVSKISASDANPIFIDSILQINGTNPMRLKFVNPNVNGAGLGIGTSASSLRIVSDSGLQFGSLEIAGLLFQTGTVPSVEGAIRYNSTSKKHEGFNGSSWNPMY
ncbi:MULTISPECIES: BppU family phage baseplate upper protein [Bacillus]|uniref:Uncharacterized protein DUF2479 n=1 Tax=Bacillus mycoides TaxID=1405 RepID=A0A3D9TX59_BACMY|nr:MULTISPECIES: BppU family phage baseplate upper protein [Bacillus]RBP17810.1 uncharacterized protein DUF2479 [Bacillus sp. DB-2]REF18324.1 uncharacterized protein DUF2479 [Bacillus mycoides]